MTRTLFIINPVSARGATRKAWSAAREKIASAGIGFDEYETTYPGEASDITRSAINDGVHNIVAVGGDGTLSEVVSGYFDQDGNAINSDSAIGLLPSGTGSDFCRSVRVKDGGDLIASLLQSKTRLIDAARAEVQNSAGESTFRTFINVASFGLGGDVSEMVNDWRGSLPRWIGGRARFAAASVVALRRYKNIEVSLRLDERDVTISTNFIVVANGRFAGGGMMLAPNAELDDGLLDVILTDGINRLDIIKELPRIQRGTHLKNRKVSETRVRTVSIVGRDRMAIDLDGEIAGFTPARLSVLPSCVRFLCAR